MGERDATQTSPAPSISRFLWLLVQLLPLTGATFFLVRRWFPGVCLIVGGFAVHYWLPRRWKEEFWFLLSFVAIVLHGGVRDTAIVVVGLGLVWAIAAAPVPWLARAAALAAMCLGLVFLGRSIEPSNVLMFFGSITMLHAVAYLYEVKHMRGRPPVREFLRYFLWAPMFIFTPSIILGYQGLQRSFLARDAHVLAQAGIKRLFLGAVQLVVLLLSNDLLGRLPLVLTPPGPSTLGALGLLLFQVYLGYLWVSGCIHLTVGTLQLFGYDLPPPYNNYALARSPLDLWRRVNIYWKDAMMRLFYMPTYFALRRRSEMGAKVAGIMVALLMSGLLHLWMYGSEDQYRRFWYPTEALFWLLLAVLASVNILVERPAKRGPERRTAWSSAIQALQILGMLLLVSSLWLLSRTESFGAWWEIMTAWTTR
jgi:alginate O-acetyltransferase complex protein AlgI